jgi:heme exporter protein A
MFSFQNITYSINERQLFKDVGFTLFDGGCLNLKGPNGSGKTTLLRILAGLVRPEYGFIFCDDFEINENMPEYQRRLHYIGHENSIDLDFTVAENLYFWGELLGKADYIPHAIKFLHLDKVLDEPVKHLSAGWKRRISLARLILKKSKIWLLDEPFANLDADITDSFLSLIASFCDQGGKVILTSHHEVRIPFGMTLDLRDFL